MARLCSVASATLSTSALSAALLPVSRGFRFAPIKDVIMGFREPQAMLIARVATSRTAIRMMPSFEFFFMLFSPFTFYTSNSVTSFGYSRSSSGSCRGFQTWAKKGSTFARWP